MASLLSNDDVIVVASVSCIYGIGDPDDYKLATIFLRKDETYGRDKLLNELVNLQYQRNDIDFTRGTFRVRGDVVEIIRADKRDEGIRVSFLVMKSMISSSLILLTGKSIRRQAFVTIFSSHFIYD